MKYFISLLLTVFSFSAKATIEVAVIDTGLNQAKVNAPLCKFGLLDFTKSGSTSDIAPLLHGSNVVSLIMQNAGSGDYCIKVLKVFSSKNGKPEFDYEAYLGALSYLEKNRPALINISSAGIDTGTSEERRLIKAILDKKIVIVAAAGNKSLDLNKEGCIIYPACADPRIYMIGNLKSSKSNYGRFVDIVIDGTDKDGGGVTLTGSSQSAAIFSGLVIRQALKLIKEGNQK
jgi:hypothetical protein